MSYSYRPWLGSRALSRASLRSPAGSCCCRSGWAASPGKAGRCGVVVGAGGGLVPGILLHLGGNLAEVLRIGPGRR